MDYFKRTSVGERLLLAVVVVAVSLSAVGVYVLWFRSGDSTDFRAARALFVFAGTRTRFDPAGSGAKLILADDTGRTVVLSSEQRYTQVRLSPDGLFIAAVRLQVDDGVKATVEVYSTVSLRRVVSVQLPGGLAPTALSWSPDGSRVAIVGSRLVLVDRQSAAVLEAPVEATGFVGLPYTTRLAWSPDSQLLGIVGSSVYVLDRDGRMVAQAPQSELMVDEREVFARSIRWRDRSTFSVLFTSGPNSAHDVTVGVAGQRLSVVDNDAAAIDSYAASRMALARSLPVGSEFCLPCDTSSGRPMVASAVASGSEAQAYVAFGAREGADGAAVVLDFALPAAADAVSSPAFRGLVFDAVLRD